MKMTVKNHSIVTIPELRELCVEANVNLVACQISVDLFWQDERRRYTVSVGMGRGGNLYH